MPLLSGNTIIVVGSGVIGLTTALRLQEAGAKVRVWTKAPVARSSSYAAGAVWYPSALEPRELTREWASHTLKYFLKAAGSDLGGQGIQVRRGKKYFYRPMGNPWWASLAPHFRKLSPSELPPLVKAGYEFALPVIDMSVYLPYLLAKFEKLGGAIELRELRHWEEALAEASFVVNATGAEARDLVPDLKVKPVVKTLFHFPASHSREIFLCSDDPQGENYIVPREYETVGYGPQVEKMKFTRVSQGTRPLRKEVRCAADDSNFPRLYHSYGHGASGVTLSWGVAEATATALIKLGVL